MSDKSDTPRTDKAEQDLLTKRGFAEAIVPTSFARQLEREFAAANEQLAAERAKLKIAEEALVKIANGEGTFSRDNYEFACNVIEESKTAVRDALAAIRGG